MARNLKCKNQNEKNKSEKINTHEHAQCTLFRVNSLENAFQWKFVNHIQWRFAQVEGVLQKANFLILLWFLALAVSYLENERKKEREKIKISNLKRQHSHETNTDGQSEKVHSNAYAASRMCWKYVLVHWPLCFLVGCVQHNNRLYGNYYLSHYLVIMCSRVKYISI